MREKVQYITKNGVDQAVLFRPFLAYTANWVESYQLWNNARLRYNKFT